MLIYLARLIGYNKYVVGWKIEADLLAMGIALPALQVIDLSQEAVVIDTLLRRERSNVEPLDFTNLSLPEAIWNCGPPL